MTKQSADQTWQIKHAQRWGILLNSTGNKICTWNKDKIKEQNPIQNVIFKHLTCPIELYIVCKLCTYNHWVTHLSHKAVCWHADRLCTADLWWQLSLSHHMLLLYTYDKFYTELTGYFVELKISYIWSCCALFSMGISMWSRTCLDTISTCVLRYW